MIDRDSRNLAASLVDGFARGTISNDQIEDSWPQSADRALAQIEWYVWSTCGDAEEYRIDPEHLDENLRATYERIILFLRSSLKYEWPELRVTTASVVVAMATLGLSRLVTLRRAKKFREAGEVSVAILANRRF